MLRRLIPLSFLSFISIFGALCSYASSITRLSMAIVTILAGASTWMLFRKHEPLTSADTPALDRGWLPLAGFAVGVIVWWTGLGNIAIVDSIRSPWSAVPVALLIALAVAAFFGQHISRHYYAVGALLLSGVALAAIVYPLGYGFDPFLHRAALTHLADVGTLTPKTPYYMGAYALELFFSKPFLSLPLMSVDTRLAPALLLFVALTFAPLLEARRARSSWLLLFLPLGAFITTTPQAIGFIFLLATALGTTLLTVGRREMTLLFSIASLLAHPIAGFFALAIAVGVWLERWRVLSISSAFAMSAFFLPASFLILARGSDVIPKASFSLSTITAIPVPWHFALAGRPALDLLYIFGSIATLIIPTLGVVALMRSRPRLLALDTPVLASALGAVIALGLMSTIPLPNLIDYEQLDYTGRVVTTLIIILLPLAARAMPSPTRAILIVLPLLFIGNVYLAYPRDDGYDRSAGFNVSKSDFATVRAIDFDARATPYVVLSNQATAAAAVQTLGFKQYFNDNVFFYPIPTGGPLYQNFLSMVDDAPRLSTIEKTRQLTSASLVYFVVHDYWWDSERLNAEAALIADRSFSAAPHVRVHVFAPRP